MANEFKVRKGLVVNGSGSVILDVQGSQGQLFSVTDVLSGSLFAVKDISGMPIIEAFSDDRVNIGTFNREAIKVSGSVASVTGSFSGSFTGSLFGTSSQATSASFSTFAYSASFAPGFSVSMSQATPALTWSFTHNLNSRNPVVQVYDTTYAQIIPNQIVGMNNSTAEIRFDYAQAGYAVFSNGGGLYVTGSTSTLVQTVGAATWSFTHNLNNKYNTYEVYDNNDYVLIPSAIKAVDNNSAELYFSGLQTGRAIAQFSGINGAPNATTASYALTASFILPLSQSVSINGFTSFYGNISGSQPANNPSSSLILISGSILPASGSTSGSSAIYVNTVMSASANNQTLVGLDINPTFTNGAFTGVSNLGLRVQNVAIGSGKGNLSGNVAIGNISANINQLPLSSITTGTYNTAIGSGALYSNTTGYSNVAVGYALYYNTTGFKNTAIGVDAGLYYFSGINNNNSSNSVFIGFGTQAGAANGTNENVIGNLAIGLGSNTTVLGNSSTVTTAIYGNLLLGTTTATGANLTTAASITAASAIARGVYFNNTLVASANSDVLVGLDINPTFTNGAFTGVSNLGLRTQRGFELYSGGVSPNSHYLLSTSTSSTDGTLQFRRSGGANGLLTLSLWNTGFRDNNNTGEMRWEVGGGSCFPTIWSNGAEAMRIASTRNVLINTTTDAGFRLDVSGSTRITNNLTVSGSTQITGSGTTNSTLDITGIQANSAVNPPKGTISLHYPGADGATANIHGASIMFSQRYDAASAAPIGMAMIAAVKVSPNGNFGGGLTFWTSNETGNSLAERVRLDASGSMGVGLTAPTALLHVSSSQSASLFRVSSNANPNAFFISGSGFVGLGALTPSGALHINSNNFNTATSTSIFITDHGNNTNDGNEAARIQFQSRYWGSDDQISAVQSAIVHGKNAGSGNGGSFLSFHTTTRNTANIFERVRISSEGVGIFKTSPSASLDVSGSMLVTGSLAMSGSFTQVGYKILTTVSQSLNYSDDTAAAAGGVPLGGLYRNGNFILIRLS